MAIWVLKDGQREGPYEEQDLRELVYEGTYADADPAIRDGQYDWTTLGRILGRQTPSAPSPATEPPSFPDLPLEAFSAPAAPAAEPPPIPAEAESAPQELPSPVASPQPIRVAVIDFEMPFGSMVMLMVKWVLASIPALLILGAIAVTFWIAFFALISAALRH